MIISAFLPVFNEEKRIEDTLRSLIWCDEIILVDKNSTDNTIALAKGFGDRVKVHTMENSAVYNPNEWDIFLDNAIGDWIFLFTASDVMHPKLAEKIRTLTNDTSFSADIIHIPFKRYVLGINDKRSPWFSKINPMVIRKRVVYLDKNEVHGALKYKGSHFKLENDDKHCMYHLTHETVDIMMDRHLRYWRGEALPENIDMKRSLKSVIAGVINLTFVRRTWLLGYDGFMLMFSYLTYLMMSFVYKWEKKRGHAPQTYAKIRKDIRAEWEYFEKN